MPLITINGATLHYEERGEGRPILCTHATPASGVFYRPQLDAFGERYRVISLDLRGHGESEKPEGAYPIAGVLTDYEALIEAFGLAPLVLMGCSIGGIVAQLYALAHPDDLRGLVLIGSPDSVRGRDVAGFKRRIADVGWDGEIEDLLGKQLHPDAPAELVGWARAEYGKTPLHVRTAEEEALATVHHPERMAEIRVPTLLVYGEAEEDRIASKMRAMAEVMGDARIHEIAGAAHYPNLEQAETFNPILEAFLAEIGY